MTRLTLTKTAAAAILAMAAALPVALPAGAEQFAVHLDTPFEGAHPRLLDTLRVSEIEIFTEDGAHYIVLDAPNPAYVEAFVEAIGPDAIALNALDADWANPVLDNLTMAQRLGFLRPVPCEFCTR